MLGRRRTYEKLYTDEIIITNRMALLKPDPLKGKDVPTPNEILVAGITISNTKMISDQATGASTRCKEIKPSVGNTKKKINNPAEPWKGL